MFILNRLKRYFYSLIPCSYFIRMDDQYFAIYSKWKNSAEKEIYRVFYDSVKAIYAVSWFEARSVEVDIYLNDNKRISLSKTSDYSRSIENWDEYIAALSQRYKDFNTSNYFQATDIVDTPCLCWSSECQTKEHENPLSFDDQYNQFFKLRKESRLAFSN